MEKYKEIEKQIEKYLNEVPPSLPEGITMEDIQQNPLELDDLVKEELKESFLLLYSVMNTILAEIIKDEYYELADKIKKVLNTEKTQLKSTLGIEQFEKMMTDYHEENNK